jgi:hypothetical protein
VTNPSSLASLRVDIRKLGWRKRDITSTEHSQPLELAGWPLFDRAQQLCQVLEAIEKPLTSASTQRRLLCTQAPPGGGKSRFLRTLALGRDAIKAALRGPLPDPEVDRLVEQWSTDLLCIHLTFGNGSSVRYSEMETKSEYLLARRLLYSYYDCEFTQVLDWHVTLKDAIELVLEHSGKSRLLLCVDEVARNSRAQATAIVHLLADVQTNFALPKEQNQSSKSFYALVSTLDSSIGVVEATSQTDSNVSPLWIPLVPPTSDSLLEALQNSSSITDEDRIEDIRGALLECGCHMRSVEFILECLTDKQPGWNLVQYTVEKLAGMYGVCLTQKPGALAFMVSSALTNRTLPWDPDDAFKFSLNDFSNLLLNSRGPESYWAVPKPSANFLRVAVKREQAAGGPRDPDDQYVAQLLDLILNPQDRGVTSSHSFEHFSRRFFALRLHAFRYNDAVDQVSLKDFFCIDPDAPHTFSDKALLDELIGTVSCTPDARSCLALATGIKLTEGCVVIMPERNPGLDVMALCKRKGGEEEGLLAMLIQVKYYMENKVPIAMIREAHTNSLAVLASLLKVGNVWSSYKEEPSEHRPHELVNNVTIPAIDPGKTLFVVFGTQDQTRYEELPSRTIVIANNHLRLLLGDIFNGTEHLLKAMSKSKRKGAGGE